MHDESLSQVVLAVGSLQDASDRVGRTHIQKFLYLAETWLGLPAKHGFTIYLHGPYARDLDSEIFALESIGVVTAEPDPDGYGASHTIDQKAVQRAITVSSWWTDLREAFGNLAREVATARVVDLEALTTAEYVLRAKPDITNDQLSADVQKIKPHLPIDQIGAQVQRLGQLRRRFDRSLTQAHRPHARHRRHG